MDATHRILVWSSSYRHSIRKVEKEHGKKGVRTQMPQDDGLFLQSEDDYIHRYSLVAGTTASRSHLPGEENRCCGRIVSGALSSRTNLAIAVSETGKSFV